MVRYLRFGFYREGAIAALWTEIVNGQRGHSNDHLIRQTGMADGEKTRGFHCWLSMKLPRRLDRTGRGSLTYLIRASRTVPDGLVTNHCLKNLGFAE